MIYLDDIKMPNNINVQKLVTSINESQQMALNYNDILFISLIAGLQISRQWISKRILNRQRYTDTEAANKVKHNDLMKEIGNKSDLALWVLGPTTYDAIKRSSSYWKKTGVGGSNHRYATLAHDPLIGLFVGPINLTSNTITYRTDIAFGTSKVLANNVANPATGYSISTKSNFVYALQKSAETIHENKIILPAAVIKHLLHLASDVDTKQGLIIPGLSMLPDIGAVKSSDINKWLINQHFDSVWFANLFVQYGLAEIVNAIGSILYKFLLYRNTTKTKTFVETKTQKVIAIANAVSASEDVIVAVTRALHGDVVGSVRDLDWGGLVAAVRHIIESDEFKNEIKETIHAWDNIKYNFSTTSEEIESDFHSKLGSIDVAYHDVVQRIQNEYCTYNKLQALAANLNQPGNEMFEYSKAFAQMNETSHILNSKQDIDNFFNN